ncbi:MAG: hypothetical protein HY905_27520 [Deltaproteobacteria bacterium]|nr:hypothetical protein [Deltaproteobacteria bacterium]
MKTLSIVTAVVVGLLATAAFAVQGEAQDVAAGCRAACEADRAEMCEPAEKAVLEGRMTEERAAAICECGIEVCANVCVCESTGETPCRRQINAECENLGVTMPE